MSESFKNYFWTAQLMGGLPMAVKMFVEGMKDSGGPEMGLLWAAGGFLAVVPIAAAVSLVRLVLNRRRERREIALQSAHRELP